MFCEKCGAKNLETSNFCANCGFNLQHSKKVVESLHEEETENAEEPLVDPENVLEDGLLWDSGEISQVPDDADLEEGQAPQVSIEEREQVSDQEGADSEVGDGSLTNGGGDSTSDDKDIASDDGGDNFSPDVKKKSGGKSVLLFLLVLAVAGGYYWFSTNKNIPVSIKFMGNFSSYQIESGDGRKYMANSRGEFVFFDTVQLLKPDTFSFSFKLNNATSPAPFKFTWDGKSLAPIDLTHSISFVRESTNFQLSFNLVPYAEGIAVDVDGKTYEFGPDQVIRIPSVKVSRKKTFKIRAYSNSKKFNLAYNKDLVVQPDGRNRISESITLKPTFKGEYKFRFSVKDELGRKVEGAKVRIGYRNGASITDKDGIAELVIKDPAISATYSPEVVKGRMAPMEDLKSGSFTTDTYMFEYNVTLKVQDIISLTVVDVNGEPLANAQATTSDGKKAKSSRDGKITLVARNRGKITEISFRKPGYVDAMTSLTVAAGENIINNPIVLQPMNVRLRVLDKLTRRSIPNIGVKISGIPEELYTTDDPFQTLFELELNKEYNLTLTDHAGGYVAKTVTETIKNNNQVIEVILEPKPRIINLQFTDVTGKYLSGVKTRLEGNKIQFQDSDSRGKVRFKVYADTTYNIKYEYEALDGERPVHMGGRWEVNQKIPVTFKTNFIVIAKPGNPEIRIVDPASDVVIESGKGTLTASIPFGNYRVECDCPGGRFEELVSLNKADDAMQINCELPIVKAQGAESEGDYVTAAEYYEKIPSSDKSYCLAQHQLFFIYKDKKKLDEPESAKRSAKLIMERGCQQINNPYVCLELVPYLLRQDEFDLAQTAVLQGFKNEKKLLSKDKGYYLNLLQYYENLVFQEETLKDKGISASDRCERLKTLYQLWENLMSEVEDETLASSIDQKLEQVRTSISAEGC